MKTPEQMKEQFNELYNLMAASNNVNFMRTFGNVHKEMMDWFIANKPDLAEEWLCKLESIKWKQYLTPKEAEKIISGMDPKAPWTKEVWKSAMESFGLPLEEVPYYNSCALWVEMNKIYSDFGDEIAALLGKPLSPNDKDIINACYKMALKNLKDKDHVYNIRSYFKV
ncbi:MAG: hypothetical protein PUC18_12660 [Prevotellaceae bacterium]|nr:hypothetical protein [Prevotellaceae bacterium]